MNKKLGKVEEGVRQLLLADERCRNDDAYLVWKYIREFDGVNMFIPFEQFKRMTPFESITRCRRKLQAESIEFQPTNPQVIAKRKLSEKQHREYALA